MQQGKFCRIGSSSLDYLPSHEPACADCSDEASDSRRNVKFVDARKVARAISIICSLPTVLYVVSFSLQSIDEYRPHGTTAFTLICYGIVAPLTLFLVNKSLSTFALTYLSVIIRGIKCPNTSDPLIQLIV